MAWLAGLLEGEGYFGMITNRVGGKAYRYPRVGVTMTDEDVVAKVAALFRLKCYKIAPNGHPTSKKMQYRAIITGWAAAEWMRRLYPLLGSRRQGQIAQVLAEYDAQEPTQKRRSRSCSEAAAARWAKIKGVPEAA